MAAIALFGAGRLPLAARQRSARTSTSPRCWSPLSLPGASPETMGASVATPVENEFSKIAGLESMTSVNSLGSTLVTLEFDLEPEPRRRVG